MNSDSELRGTSAGRKTHVIWAFATREGTDISSACHPNINGTVKNAVNAIGTSAMMTTLKYAAMKSLRSWFIRAFQFGCEGFMLNLAP